MITTSEGVWKRLQPARLPHPFLFDPLWPPPFSSQALVPVTISWWFCSTHPPSSAPESTAPSGRGLCRAQSTVRTDCPFLPDCSGTEIDGYLVLSEELCRLHSRTPAPADSLRGSLMRGSHVVENPMPQLLSLTWTLLCGSCCLLVSPQACANTQPLPGPRTVPSGDSQVPLAK